jgi:F-type H+-transporting ATPase subunit delta
VSAQPWDKDLAAMSDQLGQQGAISAAQAEMLQRLVAEVSALTGSKAPRESALVRTAVALNDDEQARMRGALARRLAPGRTVVFEVDPEVLGGVWLRVGDRIIDGTLRGRLQALRQIL